MARRRADTRVQPNTYWDTAHSRVGNIRCRVVQLCSDDICMHAQHLWDGGLPASHLQALKEVQLHHNRGVHSCLSCTVQHLELGTSLIRLVMPSGLEVCVIMTCHEQGPHLAACCTGKMHRCATRMEQCSTLVLYTMGCMVWRFSGSYTRNTRWGLALPRALSFGSTTLQCLYSTASYMAYRTCATVCRLLLLL